jgi:acyl-CoA reductase-like NAD-dependent aldehyde dehydrogenase
MSIIKVRDHQEALEIASDTDYGLAARVITNDMRKVRRLAESKTAASVARAVVSRWRR